MVDATAFVLRMMEGFCDYAPTTKTQSLYEQKLSAYKLTPDQWERVLNTLIERHQQRTLPPLGMIQAAIREAQAPTRYAEASRRGKMIFG